MKKILGLVMLGMALSLSAAEAPASAASPLTAVESLVGGRWLAQMPGPKDQPPLQLELRFVRAENGQAIRFESAWVRGDKRKAYTDGFYAWNGAKQKLAIVYTDSGGNLTEG